MMDEWVPEDLDQLERCAAALEGTTAATVHLWDAFTLSILGFSLKRVVMEMRQARVAGFDPRCPGVEDAKSGVEDRDLDELFRLAEEHGIESEPDHEVGDLQDIVRMCWHWLNPIQREDVVAKFRAQRREE